MASYFSEIHLCYCLEENECGRFLTTMTLDLNAA